MIIFIMFSFLFGASLSAQCSPGTVELPQENQCAVIKQTGDENGYFEADTSCRDLGGNLISIHNAFANTVLVAYATGVNVTDTLYIGGDNHKNGVWTWIDGSKMDYTNWAPGQMNKTGGGCMTLKLSDGKWYSSSCQKNLSYICEIQEKGLSCPSGWTIYKGNCYMLSFSDVTKYWYETRDECLHMGADLVSIHSAAENAFVQNLTAPLPVDSNYFPWIGLTYNGTYHWSDGTKVKYTNVLNPTPSHGHSIYDFASSGSNPGKWDDYDAQAGGGNAFICKKAAKSGSKDSEASKEPANIRTIAESGELLQKKIFNRPNRLSKNF